MRRTSLRDKTLTTKKDAVEEARLRLQAQEVYIVATDGKSNASDLGGRESSHYNYHNHHQSHSVSTEMGSNANETNCSGSAVSGCSWSEKTPSTSSNNTAPSIHSSSPHYNNNNSNSNSRSKSSHNHHCSKSGNIATMPTTTSLTTTSTLTTNSNSNNNSNSNSNNDNTIKTNSNYARSNSYSCETSPSGDTLDSKDFKLQQHHQLQAKRQQPEGREHDELHLCAMKSDAELQKQQSTIDLEGGNGAALSLAGNHNSLSTNGKVPSANGETSTVAASTATSEAVQVQSSKEANNGKINVQVTVLVGE